MIYDKRNFVFSIVADVASKYGGIIDGINVTRIPKGNKQDDYLILFRHHKEDAMKTVITVGCYVSAKTIMQATKPSNVIRRICKERIKELRRAIDGKEA